MTDRVATAINITGRLSPQVVRVTFQIKWVEKRCSSSLSGLVGLVFVYFWVSCEGGRGKFSIGASSATGS